MCGIVGYITQRPESVSGEGVLERMTDAVAHRGPDGFGFEPLDPSSYDLRLCGGGRLVEVADRKGRPVLKENPLGPQGDQHQYDLLLARLQGSWQVVG